MYARVEYKKKQNFQLNLKSDIFVIKLAFIYHFWNFKLGCEFLLMKDLIDEPTST